MSSVIAFICIVIVVGMYAYLIWEWCRWIYLDCLLAWYWWFCDIALNLQRQMWFWPWNLFTEMSFTKWKSDPLLGSYCLSLNIVINWNFSGCFMLIICLLGLFCVFCCLFFFLLWSVWEIVVGRVLDRFLGGGCIVVEDWWVDGRHYVRHGVLLRLLISYVILCWTSFVDFIVVVDIGISSLFSTFPCDPTCHIRYQGFFGSFRIIFDAWQLLGL